MRCHSKFSAKESALEESDKDEKSADLQENRKNAKKYAHKKNSPGFLTGAVFAFLICGFGVMSLSGLFHQLALKSLILTVKNCRRLFIIFAFFELAYYAFFFNHSLKAFNRFFKILRIFHNNSCHLYFTSFPTEFRKVRVI